DPLLHLVRDAGALQQHVNHLRVVRVDLRLLLRTHLIIQRRAFRTLCVTLSGEIPATLLLTAQTTAGSESCRCSSRPDTPTPTRRNGPGRSRSARSSSAQASSPIRSPSSVPTGIDVDRVRIEKSG